MEVERKFMLKSFSATVRKRAVKKLSVEQIYFDLFRIRKMGAEYFITVKKGKGLVRHEWEEKIPQWVFDVLKKGKTRGVVMKTRYFIPSEGARTIEVDVYKGALAPLITFECEFKSVKDARAFLPPAWTGDCMEVTGVRGFTNRFLARHGLPRAVYEFYER